MTELRISVLVGLQKKKKNNNNNNNNNKLMHHVSVNTSLQSGMDELLYVLILTMGTSDIFWYSNPTNKNLSDTSVVFPELLKYLCVICKMGDALYML